VVESDEDADAGDDLLDEEELAEIKRGKAALKANENADNLDKVDKFELIKTTMKETAGAKKKPAAKKGKAKS